MAKVSKDRRYSLITQIVKMFPTVKDNPNELVRRFWSFEGGYDLEDVDRLTAVSDILQGYYDIRHRFEPTVRQLEQNKQHENMWIDYNNANGAEGAREVCGNV